jgi:hypothetical protein
VTSVSKVDPRLALRERLARLIGSTSAPAGAPRTAVDVIVTHVEVCDKQGSGVLTKRIFGGSPGIVAVRSRDLYGGQQDFGDRAFLLAHGDSPRPEVFANVLSAFRGLDVRRVVAIPYFADDVRTTIALKQAFGASLCTYVMDDQNVDTQGIPDPLLRELLAESDLRLAISCELREAYESKFGLRFWVLPPVAEARLVLSNPAVPPPEALAREHGVVVGNIWGAQWLQKLHDTVRGSGIELDWYSNAGLRWQKLSAETLTAAGIHLRDGLPEEQLTPILRRSPYVVLPSGTLDDEDTHGFIARLSLPSKIPYVLATSNTPIIVLGHPDAAAARFVSSSGIGLVVPYERKLFREAVAEITDASTQARMRARAAEMAPSFSSEGVREWIWRSLHAGTAADDRFEHLLATAAGSRPAAP